MLHCYWTVRMLREELCCDCCFCCSWWCWCVLRVWYSVWLLVTTWHEGRNGHINSGQECGSVPQKIRVYIPCLFSVAKTLSENNEFYKIFPHCVKGEPWWRNTTGRTEVQECNACCLFLFKKSIVVIWYDTLEKRKTSVENKR